MENLPLTSVLAEYLPADRFPGRRFSERHHRLIEAPSDEVWRATLMLRPDEIRALGPLAALRRIPSRLRRRGGEDDARTEGTVFDLFTDEGFVELRRDRAPGPDGSATIVMGAAGRFWSPSDNQPIRLDDADAFLDFARPAHVKTVFEIRVDRSGPATLLSTETIVVGTDRWGTRRFAPYWALIRLPSGAIRRSWLAAIARRVRAQASEPAVDAEGRSAAPATPT